MPIFDTTEAEMFYLQLQIHDNAEKMRGIYARRAELLYHEFTNLNVEVKELAEKYDMTESKVRAEITKGHPNWLPVDDRPEGYELPIMPWHMRAKYPKKVKQ